MRYFVFLMILVAVSACVPPQQQKPVAAEPESVQYRSATWNDLPDWPGEQFAASWTAWLQSCTKLRTRAEWQALCEESKKIAAADTAAQRNFFERRFSPCRMETNAGKNDAFITGYYDVLLQGSRSFKPGRAPFYAAPDDLLTIDLGDLYPELKNKRVRGRLQGKRVVPYWDRSEIDGGNAKLDAKVLAWANDPVDAFFMQVQGSGRVQLEDGTLLRLGYADQNGHPYRSIGKWLVDQGELTLEQASMQTIRAWAKAHPQRLQELLESNPSYVFFKVLPSSAGTQGAFSTLTNGSSIAVDPKFIPLGTPIYLSSTRPDNNAALHRLVHAQDTGGAIRGPLRIDLFWGDTAEAANLAGIMKQSGTLWLLWPIGSTPAKN